MMIFGHVYPYQRRLSKYSDSDKWGARVAHHDLIAAALQYGKSIVAAHILNHHTFIDLQAIHELQARYGKDRVQVNDMARLPKLARNHDYILPVDYMNFLRLANARRASGGHSFPLCVITHNIPAQASFYAELISLFEPYDVIVTTSEAGQMALTAMIEEAIEMGQRAFGSSKRPKINIQRMPLGIDTDFLRPRSRAESRRQLQLPADAQIILYLGRLSEAYKADIEPLLHVFKEILSKRQQAFLVIAGSNDADNYSYRLQQIAYQLGITKSMKIIENFPYDQKPIIYAAADVFTSPVDNIQELFGLSIVEAMACGIPIVASDWSGYKDIVLHGKTGYLVPTIWSYDMADRITTLAPLLVGNSTEHVLAQHTVVNMSMLLRNISTLLDNGELRLAFGERARRHAVEKFSWSAVMKQLEGLWLDQWREIIQHKNAGLRSYASSYNRAFSHFATTKLNEATAVRIRRVPSKWEVRNIDSILLNLESQIDTSKVIALCADRTLRVGEITREAGGEAIITVAFLLKKGILEIQNESRQANHANKESQ
jgi:D-inositol-3-phosphate glycosyltransferase